LSGAPKNKINKESLRREIAADLGIKIDVDDPLLLAAHVAAIVTRDTIAQEREYSADNQLLSYGDVRTVLMEVRDETIKVTDQIVGVVWMKIQQGLEERVSQLGNTGSRNPINRRSATAYILGLLSGAVLMLLLSKMSFFG
jgi:hypothetical protein